MQIYNLLTRKKEEFKPINDKNVTMYVCGITPNNATHLGHAFTYVFFDVLVRYLRFKGYKVTYVQNATDVNDSQDVIQQAKEEDKTWQEVADYWIKHFHTQMDKLNVVRPTHYVKASSVVDRIIEIDKTLLEKGYAYEKNGTLYYDISKFSSKGGSASGRQRYGELSKFNKEQMILISRERGNNPKDSNKRNPLDFVLWLASQPEAGRPLAENEKYEPFWNSPWSKGRPGWHIECNAIINKFLGDQIDIHGGGRDLIFPHHESEIAQNEPFTGKSPYVKYWMHVGMVLYEGEKMSKSLGNLVLVEDLLQKYSPNAIRWLLLSHYWRQPWEYEKEELAEAEENISIIKQALSRYSSSKSTHVIARNPAERDDEAISKQYNPENPPKADNGASNSTIKQFESIMDNDIYTPRALEYFYSKVEAKKDLSAVKNCLSILGFVF